MAGLGSPTRLSSIQDRRLEPGSAVQRRPERWRARQLCDVARQATARWIGRVVRAVILIADDEDFAAGLGQRWPGDRWAAQRPED